MEQIASPVLNIKQSMQALLRSFGASDCSAALRDLVSVYLSDATQHALFEEVARLAPTVPTIDAYVSALSVLLDFDFGDDQQQEMLRVVTGLSEATGRCKSVEQADRVLSLVRRILAQEEVLSDFVLSEAPKHWDLICRFNSSTTQDRDQLDVYSALRLLEIASDARAQLAIAVPFTYASFSDAFPPLLTLAAGEHINRAAEDLLRLLLARQLVTQDDDALDSDTVEAPQQEERLAFVCEVAAGGEPFPWLLAELHKPHSLQVVRSMLHCLVSGLMTERPDGDTAAQILAYAKGVEGEALVPVVMGALVQFATYRAEADGIAAVRVALSHVAKPDIGPKALSAAAQAMRSMVQRVDRAQLFDALEDELTAVVSLVGKKTVPGVAEIVDLWAQLDVASLETHAERVLAWAKTIFTGKTVRNRNPYPAVKAVSALAGCALPAVFQATADIAAVLAEADGPDLRMACVTACIALCGAHVARDVEVNRVNSTVLALLGQLLDIAVADQSPAVREGVLRELETHPELDGHLVLSDPLECLFMAINDGATAVSTLAITLIARVAARNPSIIGPGLSRVETRLVREAQGNVLSVADEAIRTLHVLAVFKRITTPQLALETLCVDKLVSRAASFSLQCTSFSFLEAIVEQAKLTDRHMEAELLVQRALEAIRNPLCAPRRRAAADALAAVLRYVSAKKVDLMKVFREVVDVMLVSRHDTELVNSLSQVIGVIGAANQAKTVLIEGGSASSTAAAAAAASAERHELDSLKPPARCNPKLQFQNASVALYTLSKCLKGDAHQQRGLIQCMGELIDVIGPQQRQQLVPHLVPALLAWLSDKSRAQLHANILTQLRALWEQRDAFTKSMRLTLLQRLETYTRTVDRAHRSVAENLIMLLIDIARGASEDVRGHPWMVRLAQQRLIESRESRVALLCVELLEVLIFAIDKDLHHILRQVLDTAGSTNAEIQLRCLSFLTAIVHMQLVKDCCARIVHAVLEVAIATPHKHVQARAIEFLCTLVATVGQSATRFVKLIDGTLTRRKIENEHFARAMVAFHQTGGFPEVEERREAPTASTLAAASDTMFVVTSRTNMSNQQVKLVLGEALNIPPMAINVMSAVFMGGQTNIKFRFENVGSDVTNQFINLYNHEDPSLRRLEIASMTTERVSTEMSQQNFGRALNKLRMWRRSRWNQRHQEWATWLTNATLELVFCSEPALRSLSEVVKSNEMLAREIFPFAFVWVFSKLDVERKRDAMASLSGAIEVAAPEMRHILFNLAEFMESERSEQVITKLHSDPKQCVVVRSSLDEKFGIHYEGEGANIVVVKVAEGGPGHRANVPVGYTLKRIDGVEITAVSQIVGQIKNKERTVLELVKEDQRRYVSSKHRPFFDLERLATVAYNSHLYAKALHYYEMLFEEAIATYNENETEANKVVIEKAATALTNIYNVTGHPHEYAGLRRTVVAVTGSIGGDALPQELGDRDFATRTMRSFEAQGKLEDIVNSFEILHRGRHKAHDAVYNVAASAAAALGRWDMMAEATKKLAPGAERSFYEAIWSVAKNDPYEQTKELLKTNRRHLASKFASEIGESYGTAYDSLLQLQHLSHLKEVCIYRTASDSAKKRLHELWSRRLQSMARNVQHWTVTLAINSLVLSPEDDLDSRLNYASVCREVGWHNRAERVLAQLLGVDTLRSHDGKLYSESTRPRVALALFKEKYHSMRSASTRMDVIGDFEDYIETSKDRFDTDPWRGRCHLTIGEWFMAHGDPEKALLHVKRATEVDSQNIAAWHAWGMLAYRHADSVARTDADASADLIVSSLEGLSRAVELGEELLGTQDLLRILSIWMDYGHRPRALRAVQQGVARCPISAWLRVIPQLIARLGTCHRGMRSAMESLVHDIAGHFPHALIYPLTVTEKNGRDAHRRAAATQILNSIREANPALVDQASLISDELVRIAILWSEKWTEQLTRTSRIPERQECKAVLDALQTLFEELENPVTGDEKLFESHYGQTLRRAKSALGTDTTAAQAWNFFQQVYQKISRPARSLTLASVSPRLSELKNSVIPVPGLGTSSAAVTIAQFNNDIHVIPSKHKPRRFALVGSDGVEYRFLLKGHEDLRQDERVMQLFDLLNTVFRADPTCNSLGLRIVRYTAVPLSDNVGILTWLDNSETLFKLIEARRSATGVSMHEECNLIVKRGRLQKIEDYQGLPKPLRKELLTFAIDSTPADEMRRIMWDANDTCEAWLSYRVTYGRTLAVMSMSGYLLGLGDRHLNNLMIQKDGAIVHIDFGDCFEVAMAREQFPERVPFRLTRLLVRALGVMEVEGTYRLTSELVMKQIRKFRDSLLSVLETFVEDPLVTWRSRKNAAGQSAAAKPAHVDPEATDSPTGSMWTAFVDRLYETLGEGPDARDKAAHQLDSRCRALMLLPHDEALTQTRAAIIAELRDRGVEQAVALFVAYLPILASDIRVSSADLMLASKEEIVHFFSQTPDAPHRDFGDRALNRIKSKLSGTDFGHGTSVRRESVGTSPQKGTSSSPTAERSTAAANSATASQAFNLNPDFFLRDSVFAESVDVDPSREDGVVIETLDQDGLNVVDQVNRLIAEARSMDNLADSYLTGWAPFL